MVEIFRYNILIWKYLVTVTCTFSGTAVVTCITRLLGVVGLTTGLKVDMAVEGLTRYVAGVDEKNGRGFGFSWYGLIAISKIYQ